MFARPEQREVLRPDLLARGEHRVVDVERVQRVDSVNDCALHVGGAWTVERSSRAEAVLCGEDTHGFDVVRFGDVVVVFSFSFVFHVVVPEQVFVWVQGATVTGERGLWLALDEFDFETVVVVIIIPFAVDHNSGGVVGFVVGERDIEDGARLEGACRSGLLCHVYTHNGIPNKGVENTVVLRTAIIDNDYNADTNPEYLQIQYHNRRIEQSSTTHLHSDLYVIIMILDDITEAISEYRARLGELWEGYVRGVSPVVGVILMVAITVILAAIVGVFAFDIGDGMSSSPTAAYEASETHSGGATFTMINQGTADEVIVEFLGEEHSLSVGETLDVPGGAEYNVYGVVDGDRTLMSSGEFPTSYTLAWEHQDWPALQQLAVAPDASALYTADTPAALDSNLTKRNVETGAVELEIDDSASDIEVGPDTYLYRVNSNALVQYAEDGTQTGEVALDGPSNHLAVYDSSSVYTHDDNVLHKADMDSETIVDSYSLSTSVVGITVDENEHVYVADSDGTITEFDATGNTLSVENSITVGEDITSIGVESSGGNVFVGTNDGTLYSYEMDSEAMNWEASVGDDYIFDIATDENDDAYIGVNESIATKYSAEGTQLWAYDETDVLSIDTDYRGNVYMVANVDGSNDRKVLKYEP